MSHQAQVIQWLIGTGLAIIITLGGNPRFGLFLFIINYCIFMGLALYFN